MDSRSHGLSISGSYARFILAISSGPVCVDLSRDKTLCNGFTDSDAKTICIVGGGAAGLACLKVILDTDQYKYGLWKPVLFESRDQVGGVW